MRLSVIIPLAPGEEAWRALLPDLAALPPGSEILLAWPQGTPACGIGAPATELQLREICAGRGRAAQMNAAARMAAEDILWFLHADSRLGPTSMTCLWARIEEFLTHSPEALLYFDLKFLRDATPLMKLNEWGAFLRSRLLGMPFGDQGFCLRRDVFQKLQGYPEDLAYGEDHMLTWRARHSGVRLCPVKAPLYSSARKYSDNGWLKTTARHLFLTYAQAWPQFCRLFFRRNDA